MKTPVLVLCALVLSSASVLAQTVLSIDFTERLADQTTNAVNLQAGFDPFLINSNTSITAVQSGNAVRTFSGGLTVTLAGVGTTVTYDDRQRNVPVNSGAFTQGALLRDFVFNGSANNGDGLSLTIDGLVPAQFYKVTIWSYDNSSTGNRVSDWTANGATAKAGYVFNGSTLPTSDAQYQFDFKTAADGTGRVVIEGRRNAATSSAGGVFVNALQMEVSTANPDPPVIGTQPTGSTLYRGDNAILSSLLSSGTAPVAFQWYRNATNLVANATNTTLVVSNAQLADAGAYTMIATNISGSATSAPAVLAVLPITNILTGLLAYWPLDTLTDFTPDVGSNSYHLWATNMDGSNLAAGQRGNALTFNGVDEFVIRTNAPGEALPASGYPAYSVTLWVKGSYVGQSDRRVFSEGSNTNNNTLLTIGTDNRTDATQTNGVDIFIRNNNAGNPINHRHSSLPAFDGAWHHIAWVDNNGFAQLYVDGVQDTNDFNYVRGVLTANIESLGVVYRTNAAALFNGQIDDVGIWRRSLTQTEVRYVRDLGAVAPQAYIKHFDVTAGTVTMVVTPFDPNITYFIDEATDLNGTPINWNPVAETAFTRDGNDLVVTFAVQPGPAHFFRVRY